MKPKKFRGIFRTDELARAVYSEGAGIARILPRAVAVPADAADVRALVAWARDTATPLVPRGSGSGMAGGATGSGIIVDLSRLGTIRAVDTDRRRVEVGPGALRAAVDAQARTVGLRFPVDPSSGQFCTVGGMASTNAAGAHTLRYGAMREWITAIDCVFEDGSRAVVRRGEAPPMQIPAVRRFMEDVSPTVISSAPAVAPTGLRKQSSGYALVEYARSGELVDLLVGSEGTLALFVKLELSLAPAPAATISLLAAFDDLEAAVRAAGDARRHGASACELLDRTFLEVAAMGDRPLPVPGATEAVLLTEIEGDSAAEAADAGTTLKRAFLDAGAVEVTLAYTPEVEDALWALRHAASPILSRLDPQFKSMQFIEDGAVPPDRLADYVLGVRAALKAHEVRGVIFGHAGDGHIHVNPLVDVGRPDWRDRVAHLLDDVVDLTARLGGTLTGEHGDGRLRAPVLDRIWPPEALAMFARVKDAFDPDRILNPGVKVPLDGQRPIDAVKYDPSLPPLPDLARKALDHVERERAYHRFRLALLDELE